MGGRPRSAAEKARHRKLAASWYLRGWLQAEIAAKLEVSIATVSRDLAWIRETWLQAALIDYNEAVARELARIDELERVYWARWEWSLQPRKQVVQQRRGDKYSAGVEVVSTEEPLGDLRCLEGVQWCIDRRCKLLGLDQPSRSNVELELPYLAVLERAARDYETANLEPETGSVSGGGL